MLHVPGRRTDGPLVIFSDRDQRPDWHLDRLLDVLRARGEGVVTAFLPEVSFEIGGRVPVQVPGCGGVLPRAALVRGIGAGSFEEITIRLGALAALERLGVRVWNGEQAIRRCVDKSATSLALATAGLPTPRTLATASRGRALDFLAREVGTGNRVVLKPLLGAEGRGLRLLARARDLPEPDEVDGVYYLQRFVDRGGDGPFRDFRVFVAGGRVVAGMVRQSDHWITNVRRGARPLRVVVDQALARLSLAAAAATGADFAGVDLVEDGRGGFSILEVNAMPAWQGLQSASEVDVASALVDAWLADVPAAAAL